MYARGDRGWQGIGPPAAAYFYTPDRKGERPGAHLTNFSGFLQADGYAGYEHLYDGRRQPSLIVEVACWQHVRRKIYDVWKATGSTTARTGVSDALPRYHAIGELARQMETSDATRPIYRGSYQLSALADKGLMFSGKLRHGPDARHSSPPHNAGPVEQPLPRSPRRPPDDGGEVA